MRAKTLVAVSAFSLALAVAPGAAWAAEEESPFTKEQIEQLQGDLDPHGFHCTEENAHKMEEALHLVAEEGANADLSGIGALQTCEESPNPILPEINEVIWAVISFAVLFLLLAKFAFPAIRKGLEGREQAVRDDLESAERARVEAEESLAQYRQQLADARNEAARIIEEARQAADALRREVQESAEADANAIRERADADAGAAVTRARAELERQVAAFAVDLAERIIQRNLDRDAQLALVDQYINEVGGLARNGG